MACCQRLCLRSGGLSKPRPVPDTKRWTKITLWTNTAPHHCANILLATCALLLSTCKSVVSVASRCHDIELIVTVHGCPFVIHFFCHRNFVVKLFERGGQPWRIFLFTLTNLSSIGAGVRHSWQRLWIVRLDVLPLASVLPGSASLSG